MRKLPAHERALPDGREDIVAETAAAVYSASAAFTARSSARLSEWPVLRARYVTEDRAAQQIEVADQVEHLVAREFVGESAAWC